MICLYPMLGYLGLAFKGSLLGVSREERKIFYGDYIPVFPTKHQ